MHKHVHNAREGLLATFDDGRSARKPTKVLAGCPWPLDSGDRVQATLQIRQQRPGCLTDLVLADDCPDALIHVAGLNPSPIGMGLAIRDLNTHSLAPAEVNVRG